MQMNLITFPLRYTPNMGQYPKNLSALEIVMFEHAWHDVRLNGGTLSPNRYLESLGAQPVQDEFFEERLKNAEMTKQMLEVIV